MSGADKPRLPSPGLPSAGLLWRQAWRSYALVWAGRRALLRAAALPLLVLLLVNLAFAGAYGPRWMLQEAVATGEGRSNLLHFLGLLVCHLMAHSLFAVAWLRLLLSDGARRPALLPTPAGVHLKFQLAALLVAVAILTCGALAIIVGGILDSHATMLVLALLAGTYVAARLQLLWPAIADQGPVGARDGWAASRAEQPRLWALLVLLLLPPAALAGLGDALFAPARAAFLASGVPSLGAALDSLLASAAALLALAVAAVPATDAYRRLEQGRPGLF